MVESSQCRHVQLSCRVEMILNAANVTGRVFCYTCQGDCMACLRKYTPNLKVAFLLEYRAEFLLTPRVTQKIKSKEIIF